MQIFREEDNSMYKGFAVGSLVFLKYYKKSNVVEVQI